MTIESWKQEFYPISVEEAAKGTVQEAINHSRIKWYGLRQENLEKHGLVVEDGYIAEKDFDSFDNLRPCVPIDSETCALCWKYDSSGEDGNECAECPIVKVRGMPCDEGAPGNNPWGSWSFNKNPEPMIAVLEQCKKEFE